MKVPLKVPVAVGWKTTVVVQLAPAANVVPHPNFKIANGAVIPAPFTVIAEVVLLVRTTLCDELVVPTVTEPKLRLVGEIVTAAKAGVAQRIPRNKAR